MNAEQMDKREPVPLDFTIGGKRYSGQASPLKTSCREGFCYELDVELNGEFLGTIYCGNDMHWTLQEITDQELVNRIGEEIRLWYGNEGSAGEITEHFF